MTDVLPRPVGRSHALGISPCSNRANKRCCHLNGVRAVSAWKAVAKSIVTGIDALGRGQDLANLDAFIDGALQKSPDAGKRIKWSNYLTRRANALGIDAQDELVMTEEEFAAQQQQEMQMQMMQQLGPNAVNQLGGIAQKSMETQSGQSAPTDNAK